MPVLEKIAIIFLSLFCVLPLKGQEIAYSQTGPSTRGPSDLRICFYNVENLFDTSDDPTTSDDEFLSSGRYEWSRSKYYKKTINIAKTIIAMGGWEPPELIGLAEVENWQVLFDLTAHSPLKKFDYRIVHQDSPDPRGVDVGLIFRPEKLKLIDYRSIPYKSLESDTSYATRDVLYASFMAFEQDTFHVFVNHWPSRYSGKEATEHKRIHAARLLKHCVDSLQSLDAECKIMLMGDFNDEPDDTSLKTVLKAGNPKEKQSFTLVNMMWDYRNGSIGTLYHTEAFGRWYLFDQVIVSRAFFNSTGLRLKYPQAYIFQGSWLLDENTGRPKRSFRGPVFVGGYSDHLPVYIDIMK